MKPPAKIKPAKAAEIVRDGSVRGKPLTPKQNRFMRAAMDRKVTRG